ncbi:glutathione transferase GstA [Methylocystis heyeri]|uniref:Glutathione transferase GstA n=1 Tax=Methylocystis heyeri TaxID=391905 RepID=A0A6B8KH40_9HYPH|nr:glutathione transferase GstA [Methylocystis heyeri]QGM46942.1 glutathione transferase GstA [Methylocystis heyeri]
MKLYFAPNACSLSPHIVLQELGLSYDLVCVNNRTKRTSEGGDFREINPKGYVAALVIDSGEVLTEGPALLQYLADLRPEAGLAPASGTLARVRLQEWLNYITSEVHAGSSPLFDEELPEAARNIFKSRLVKRLGLIEARLAEHAYLLGDGFSVADAYLFTVLEWMPALAVDLVGFANVTAYVERIAARPSVVAARAREARIDCPQG